MDIPKGMVLLVTKPDPNEIALMIKNLIYDSKMLIMLNGRHEIIVIIKK